MITGILSLIIQEVNNAQTREQNSKNNEASGIMVEAKHHKFTFTY